MNLLERAQHSQEILRNKRARLFKAFDIYKQNVSYGLVSETQEKHEAITEWYNACLELDYEAINNCPQDIQRYL